MERCFKIEFVAVNKKLGDIIYNRISKGPSFFTSTLLHCAIFLKKKYSLKSDYHLPVVFICFNESPLKMMKNGFYSC